MGRTDLRKKILSRSGVAYCILNMACQVEGVGGGGGSRSAAALLRQVSDSFENDEGSLL